MKWFLLTLLFTLTANATPVKDYVSIEKNLGALTTVQRDALTVKRSGMIVYNTTDETFQKYNGSSWDDIGGAQTSDPTELLRYYEDFAAYPIPSSYTAGTFARSSGSGSITGVANDDERNGVLALGTASSATGAMSVLMGATTLTATGGTLTASAGIKTGPNLSDGSQTYNVLFGFTNDNTTVSPIRGAYFRYDSAVSPNWRIVSRKTSVETITTTSIPYAVSTKYNLKVVCTPTAVTYYIDGVLVGTHTTNIPDSASEAMIPHATIIKSVGTTERYFELDWIEITKVFNPARK